MCLAWCVGWLDSNVQNAPCPHDKLTDEPFEHAHAWLSATRDVNLAAQLEVLLSRLGHMKSYYS